MLKTTILILCMLLSNTIYALNLRSNHVAIYNENTDSIVYEKHSRDKVSIASLTKLMTAIVTLESNQNLSEIITITKEDVDKLKNTKSRLNVGEKLTKDKALLLMLMSSENRAASALLRNYPGGTNAGLQAIKVKIQQLNLIQTNIVDANGLNPQNTSCAIDLIKIVKYASKFDKIVQYSTSKQYNFGKKIYINSNPIVRANSFMDISLSKTGFINEAGMCLVMRVKIKNTHYIMIFLKSNTKNDRVNDAKTSHTWLYNKS